jgi:hypothetical protein
LIVIGVTAAAATAVIWRGSRGVDHAGPGGASDATRPAVTTPSGTLDVPRPIVTKAIDLNVAPVEDLETLPGITPDYAHRIVAGRPYRSLEDVERTGVPKEVLAHISPPATLVVKDGAGPLRKPPRGSRP